MTRCHFSNTLPFCKVCLYYSITCPLNTAWAIHLSAGRVSQTQPREFTDSVRRVLPQRQILLTLLSPPAGSQVRVVRTWPRQPFPELPQGSPRSHLDSSICLLQPSPLGRGRALALRPERRGSRDITRVRFSRFLPSRPQGSNGSELGIPSLGGKLMIQQVGWIHTVPVTHTFIRKTSHQ